MSLTWRPVESCLVWSESCIHGTWMVTKEVSVEAAVAAVLPVLDGIFSLKTSIFAGWALGNMDLLGFTPDWFWQEFIPQHIATRPLLQQEAYICR